MIVIQEEEMVLVRKEPDPAAVGAAHAGGAHGRHPVFGTAETRDDGNT